MAQARTRPGPTANVAAVSPTTTSSTATAQQSQSTVDPWVLDALQGRTQPDYVVTSGGMVIAFEGALVPGTPVPVHPNLRLTTLSLPPGQATWPQPPQTSTSFVASGAAAPGIDPHYTSGPAEGSSAWRGNRQNADNNQPKYT